MNKLNKLICIMLFAIVILNCNESRAFKKFAKQEYRIEITN